jgi:hypothetical protein
MTGTLIRTTDVRLGAPAINRGLAHRNPASFGAVGI